MPRSSAGASSSKRQGLHHHHSNGLVAPVKRPSRSGSTSNGSTVSATAAPNASSSQQVAGAANQFQPTTTNGGVANGYTNGWDGKAFGRRYSDGLESDLSESFQNGMNGTVTAEHRQIDINPSGKTTIMTGGVPSTVLSSFPLLDTITLLIIFLQLPSTILTIIHFLFASLTFVPPSTTLLSASTTSSLPSITNLLLQGSNGAPSLLTIIFADILVALLSMFLWPSARMFLIDFAQAVIAISMGAGHASGGTLRNVVVCAGVMGGVKVVQGRFKLSDAWDGIQPNSESFIGVSSSGMAGRIGSSAGWIRSAIAVHIVAQGVMRATRRWLIRRPDTTDASAPGPTCSKDSTISSGKQKDKDPEAAAGALPQPLERENSTAGTTSGRRKKKNQIQHIRENQPLWATMASAIVHIAKEVEQSQISSEASNPNPVETGALSNDSGLSSGEDVRVWITRIGSTDIGFSASFFGARMGRDDMYGMNGGVVVNGVDGSGKDGTFPLFVRVNGIVWPQTDIYKTTRARDIDGENGEAMGVAEDEWTIEITGLTGATEYDFEFVKKEGLEVIYKTSACTMPAQGMYSISGYHSRCTLLTLY